jgi:hypothetical protein
MRPLLWAALSTAFFLVACGAPCETITPSANFVCHQADAGPIASNAAFVLRAQPNTFVTACSVAVDAGAIVLSFAGGTTCGARGGQGAPAPLQPIACTVPALPSGTYSLNTTPATTLTIPQGADGGVPPCN